MARQNIFSPAPAANVKMALKWNLMNLSTNKANTFTIISFTKDTYHIFIELTHSLLKKCSLLPTSTLSVESIIDN